MTVVYTIVIILAVLFLVSWIGLQTHVPTQAIYATLVRRPASKKPLSN